MPENRDWKDDMEKVTEMMQSLGKINENPSVSALLDKLGKTDFSAAESFCNCCCSAGGGGGNA